MGREGRVGSTVYGTVLVLATLTAAYAAARHNPRSLVELVITVVVVFWVAYVYAHALSDSIETGERLSRSGIGAVASRELGLILAAIVPVLALVAGGVGLIDERASVWSQSRSACSRSPPRGTATPAWPTSARPARRGSWRRT